MRDVRQVSTQAATVAPVPHGGPHRLYIARGLRVAWGALVPETARGSLRLLGSVCVAHVREGRVTLVRPDDSRVEASEGDVVLLGQSLGSVRVELRHGPVQGLALEVDERSLTADLRRTLASLEVDVGAIGRMVTPECPVLLVRPAQELSRAFVETYPLVEKGDLCHARLKVMELLLCLAREAPSPACPRADAEGASARGRHLQIALLAQREMLRDVSQPKTISTLAAACGTSATVLKESFREAFGVPIHRWYREYRVRLAANALLVSDLTIAEVAASVGYSNPSKFAKAFLDTMGTTPHEWRASHGASARGAASRADATCPSVRSGSSGRSGLSPGARRASVPTSRTNERGSI